MGKIENLARGPHELKRWRSPSFECRIRRRRFSLCNRTSLSLGCLCYQVLKRQRGTPFRGERKEMSGLENIKNENVDLVFYSFLSSGLINCYHAHKTVG